MTGNDFISSNRIWRSLFDREYNNESFSVLNMAMTQPFSVSQPPLRLNPKDMVNTVSWDSEFGYFSRLFIDRT